jgi:hypothetical protein
MTLRSALAFSLLAFQPIQTSIGLPITIEVQRDVDVIHNALPYESKGVLYLYEPSARDFSFKKGQRFEMVETLPEGSCRIRFEGKTFGITSCPWLPGFADHQAPVFRVIPNSGK